MSKKEKDVPLDEEKEPQSSPAGEPEETAEEAAPETFTVTKEQMEKMEGLAQQLAAQNDKYLRLAAEYDNYRKRTSKEKESIYQDAKLDTIGKFLEVYDNLDPAGEAFDPERHEAVMHIDSEELGESVVSQVFQKGFLLGDKVIRFAKVQVAN